MGQTRMFRDRVVSMEQTLEGGEKHLALLKESAGRRSRTSSTASTRSTTSAISSSWSFGRRTDPGERIAWTRMVLFDVERIPTLTADPACALRARIVQHPADAPAPGDRRHLPPSRGGLDGHAGAASRGAPPAPRGPRRRTGYGAAAGGRAASGRRWTRAAGPSPGDRPSRCCRVARPRARAPGPAGRPPGGLPGRRRVRRAPMESVGAVSGGGGAAAARAAARAPRLRSPRARA